MPKQLRVTALVVAVSVAFGGSLIGSALAQSASSSQGTSQKTTFTFGKAEEPSSLNPMVGYLGTDYTLWAMNYDLLFNFGTKDFGVSPGLATKVVASPDGLTFTYTLRSGVKWSDGQPFSASDVAWTLNYYKQHNISNYASDLALMDTATALNPTTVVITSTKPTSLYSGQATFLYEYILPEHIWGKLKEPQKFQNVPSVGTGPFIIKEYQTGNFVRLERNPYYWGTKPNVDEVVYKIYNNEDAEAAGLKTGEIDFGYFNSANIINSLAKEPNIDVRGAGIPSFSELGINTGSAYETNPAGGFTPHGDGARALTDPVVRRAIRMAVDSKTLVQKVLLGYGTPATTPVPPVSIPGAHWEPTGNQALSFNIPAANALLDQAGYKMGPDGVRIDPKTGKPLDFRYYTRNADETTIKAAPFIQGWLKQIGIKTEVQALSNGKLTSDIEAGNYDLFHWGWFPNPDPDYILGIFTCGERPPKPGVYANSDSYYCNPQYDKLYQEQKTTLDLQKRLQIVQQMQQIVYHDSPYVLLYYDQQLEAYRTDKFTGFIPQPAGSNGDLLATYGPFSFISLRPVTGANVAQTARGIPAGVWIGIAVALVIVVGGVTLARRRGGDEDRA